MKKRYVLVLVASILLAVQGLGLGPAQGLTTTYTGTIDAADPEMPVLFITTPNCTGEGAELVHYEVIEFANPEDGLHTFDLTVGVDFAGMYLFEGSFDPTDALPTCVAATNSDPATISYDFTGGTPYFLVVFDDTFDQTGGSYEVVAETPDPPATTTTTSTTTSTTAQPSTTAAATPVPAVAPAARAAAATPRFTG